MFDVKKCLNKYTTLCNEALETQTTLLEMPMPDPEHDKQQHWLTQKIEEINRFEGYERAKNLLKEHFGN